MSELIIAHSTTAASHNLPTDHSNSQVINYFPKRLTAKSRLGCLEGFHALSGGPTEDEKKVIEVVILLLPFAAMVPALNKQFYYSDFGVQSMGIG